MKIIDIPTFGVNLGSGNHIFVKVLTDEHLQRYPQPRTRLIKVATTRVPAACG